MQKDFEAFIRQGNKFKEGHGSLLKKGLLVYVKKKKKKGRKRNVRKIFFSFYMWRGAHGRVCVRIKHERNLCSKCLCQSLWTFGSISFFLSNPPLDLCQI